MASVKCYVTAALLGTRYKRRGVDEEGYTANYVETEQVSSILQFSLCYCSW